MSQLALPLKLADHAVFASFLPTGNEAAVAALVELGNGSRRNDGAWVWGPLATGKSHLLQAVCESAPDTAMYLPLADLKTSDPGLLEGIETCSIVCLDDADSIAGHDEWERALFNLYNALDDLEHALVFASTASPQDAPFRLPDLLSRLRKLPAFHLTPLDDVARAEALTLRAKHRGLELPEETTRYLLRRSPRDMQSLYRLLDSLASAAMHEQRRLTVPFVKTVLESERVKFEA